MNHYFFNILSQLKSAQLLKKNHVNIKRIKSCENFLDLLWKKGFIIGYKINKYNKFYLTVILKYDRKGNPVINNIKLLNKPGHKISYNLKQIWKFNKINGLLVISGDNGFYSAKDQINYNKGGYAFAIIN